MKRALIVLTTLGVLVLVGCGLFSPAAAPISHVYAFGDSYSDNGNLKKLTPDWPWELDWEGRSSNGPTAVEILATRLNVELTDYAVGGAKSGPDNVNPLPNTGALGQIEQFKNLLNGQSADPNALYFLMIGGNDFLEKVLYKGTISNLMLTDSAANNIATGVTQLAQLGARRFLIIPSFDLAALPFVIIEGQSEQAAEFQTLMNAKLSSRFDKLKTELTIEITVFDYVALSAKIREKPSDYGLGNVSDACQPKFYGVKPACTSPDQYYFWDEIHPTRRTHQIFGEAYAALFGK